MPLPEPMPALVVRYGYLWRSQAADGREEGAKARPAVVVVAVAGERQDARRVVVAPITHVDPGPGRGIAIPQKVAAALGLDDERSWIVTDDLNVFDWPGYDLHPLPGHPGRFAYGHLPSRLFLALRDAILRHRPPVVPTSRS